MTPYEVPLSPNPQIFQIDLNKKSYWLTVHWNPPGACWLLDISDDAKNRLVSSVAIVCGADLLEQFAYLGIEGQLIAQTDHDPDAAPTLSNLGKEGHLFFLVA